MIEAVAWDIDGTLVNSEPLHLDVLKAVCAETGIDIADYADDHFIGVHQPDVWAALAPRAPEGVTGEAWMARGDALYMARATELEPLADMLPVMRALRDAGLRQVCVSNSGRAIVDANLSAIGVDDLIEFSISFDDVKNGKPDPEPYAAAAARLGLPPGRIAAVEDSATGLASARAAGLRTFALSPDGKRLAGADHTVAGLHELPALMLPAGARRSEPAV